MNPIISSKKWFSIIEVMIGIFVFALWLTSIYMMLSGSIKMSDQSRNLIIATHLANEQLELYKNIRDSNFQKWKFWSLTNPSRAFGDTEQFEVDNYYTLQNNYSTSADFPIKVEKIIWFVEWVENLQDMDMYRLYYDDLWRYTHEKWDNAESDFYRYLHVEEIKYDNDGMEDTLDNAVKVTAHVVWTHGSYHATQVSTVVSDWKRY